MAKNMNGEKPNFFARVGGAFARFFKKLGKFFKEVTAEVKQLTWPTKKELLNYCLAVVCFVALMALLIGLLDLGFGSGFDALATLGK